MVKNDITIYLQILVDIIYSDIYINNIKASGKTDKKANDKIP